MSYYDDDHTEKSPQFETTEQAEQYGFTNPYMQSPYEESSDLPPPPPPPDLKKKRRGFLWVFSGSLLVVVLLLLSFLVYVLYGNSHAPTGNNSTPVPTTASTPTPLPATPTIIIETPTPQQATPTLASLSPSPTSSVPYYAIDIYNAFVANGLGGSNPKQDTNWSCCTYVPAGGAIYWNDNQSGHALDIATFYNNQDAETDALDLVNKGFNTNVVHACLLSYDRNVPTSVINPYLQVMQQYCV
jgi:hypothetical protein